MNIKLFDGGRCPERKTNGSAGADCYARLSEKAVLLPGEVTIIPLGFAIEIPDGFEMQIRPRSGMSKKNINISLGTIDSDYRGEVCAIVRNNSNEIYNIYPQDRIAQAVICPVFNPTFTVCDELSETERGTGGFGSTGIN